MRYLFALAAFAISLAPLGIIIYILTTITVTNWIVVGFFELWLLLGALFLPLLTLSTCYDRLYGNEAA